jgi:hypothetical protein
MNGDLPKCMRDEVCEVVRASWPRDAASPPKKALFSSAEINYGNIGLECGYLIGYTETKWICFNPETKNCSYYAHCVVLNPVK